MMREFHAPYVVSHFSCSNSLKLESGRISGYKACFATISLNAVQCIKLNLQIFVSLIC